MTTTRISIGFLESLLHLSGLRVQINNVEYNDDTRELVLTLMGPDVPNVPEIRVQYTQSIETKLVPIE